MKHGMPLARGSFAHLSYLYLPIQRWEKRLCHNAYTYGFSSRFLSLDFLFLVRVQDHVIVQCCLAQKYIQ